MFHPYVVSGVKEQDKNHSLTFITANYNRLIIFIKDLSITSDLMT